MTSCPPVRLHRTPVVEHVLLRSCRGRHHHRSRWWTNQPAGARSCDENSKGHQGMTQDEQLRRERQAMRTEIHQIVFDRLTTNMWAPGERLSIDGLARELNVSPTPVREALVSLELSGLITYRAQRGYVVAQPLDQVQIDELIDARLVVERAALSRAFRKNWQELADQLASAHDAHAQTAARIQRSDRLDYGLVRDYFEADTEIHRQFLTLAANEFLSATHAACIQRWYSMVVGVFPY